MEALIFISSQTLLLFTYLCEYVEEHLIQKHLGNGKLLLFYIQVTMVHNQVFSKICAAVQYNPPPPSPLFTPSAERNKVASTLFELSTCLSGTLLSPIPPWILGWLVYIVVLSSFHPHNDLVR